MEIKVGRKKRNRVKLYDMPGDS